jgi:phage tail-like protein
MLLGLGRREDPVLGFNFTVSLLDSSSSLASSVASIALNSIIADPAAGFNECTGLGASLEVESYEAGGNNGTVLKFPTRVKWDRLVFKHGLTRGTELWDWFYGFVTGTVQRKDGVVTLLDEQRSVHTAWGFTRGLPVRYQGPELRAQHSAVAFESIEIEHEGLYQLPGARGLSALVSGVAGAVSSVF